MLLKIPTEPSVLFELLHMIKIANIELGDYNIHETKSLPVLILFVICGALVFKWMVFYPCL